MTDKIHRNALQHGHKLHWYRIERVLGQGGFGITYLAHDFNLDRLVAIKEYLPIELAVREGDCSIHPVSEQHGDNYHLGRERFIAEAKTLAKFEHPNIVRVLAVFETNNTGYMVMSYEQGESFQDILSRRKILEEGELLNILIPILGGLQKVHESGFIHRDIKPANIFIRKDGSPVLLDFGSARQALGIATQTLTSLVSPGYAPYEQYFSKGDAQGPWTDIYGLGATLYRAIAGVAPQDAVDRSKAILKGVSDIFVSASEIGRGRYSNRFLSAIDHALKFKEEERPQSIAEWRREFAVLAETSGAAQGVIQPLVTPVKAKSESHLTAAPSQTTALPETRVREAHVSPIALITHRRIYGAIGFLVIATAFGWYHQEKLTEWIGTFTTSTPKVEEAVALVTPADELVADREAGESAKKTEASKQRLAEEEQRRTDVIRQQADVEAKRQQDEEQRRLADRINTLLQQARIDIDALRLTSPLGQNALMRYREVLNLDPENAEAQQGIQAIIDKFIMLAQQAAAVERFDEAEGFLKEATAIAPQAENVRLAEQTLTLKKTEHERKLADAGAKRQEEQEAKRKAEEITKLLSAAQDDMKALRLTSPAGSNALERYQAVLTLDPGNAEAQKGVQDIVDKYVNLARQALANGDLGKASTNLDKAAAIKPDAEGVTLMRQELVTSKAATEQKRLAAEEEQRKQDEEKRAQEEATRLAEEQRRQEEEVTRLAAESAQEKPGIEFKGMLFFEGPENPTYVPKWEELTTVFNTGSRYIYTMLQLNNFKYQISEQTVSITLKYFKPDGTLFGGPVINHTIPADWSVAELWHGWGWQDPGYWEVGDWRVEAWLNNSTKLGEYYFKVVSN